MQSSEFAGGTSCFPADTCEQTHPASQLFVRSETGDPVLEKETGFPRSVTKMFPPSLHRLHVQQQKLLVPEVLVLLDC